MSNSIASSILSLATTRSRQERRSSRRLVPARVTPCRITLPDRSQTSLGWIHNLSLKGAGILTSRACPIDTVVQLYVVNAAHTFGLPMEMRIVRCQRIVNGDYIIGGLFSRELQFEELTPFMV